MSTEDSNLNSRDIDRLSTLEMVELINREDRSPAAAVYEVRLAIATAIDRVADALRSGGRLVYIGAGTSGRLGVLDASECPPTYRTEPWQVIGIIAGGQSALTNAIEGAEDDRTQAIQDLKSAKLSDQDVLVGIATSGRTPYVLSAVEYARELGCFTIGIACNRDSPLEAIAELPICPIVGPEVITGSTRMKAGTATKMVLNMLTTGAMIRLGKTYGNRMVDLRASNQKLVNRSGRILAELTHLPDEACRDLLNRADGEVKTALVMHKLNVDAKVARRRLNEVDGVLHHLFSDT